MEKDTAAEGGAIGVNMVALQDGVRAVVEIEAATVAPTPIFPICTEKAPVIIDLVVKQCHLCRFRVKTATVVALVGCIATDDMKTADANGVVAGDVKNAPLVLSIEDGWIVGRIGCFPIICCEPA